jgi:hypothetical protein
MVLINADLQLSALLLSKLTTSAIFVNLQFPFSCSTLKVKNNTATIKMQIIQVPPGHEKL